MDGLIDQLEHAPQALRRSARHSATSAGAEQRMRGEQPVAQPSKRKRLDTSILHGHPAEPESSVFDGAIASKLPPTKGAQASRKKTIKIYAEDSDGPSDADAAPKKKRKAVAEPTYTIPDVETKPTTFRGRLGYACINTVLRNKKPASESVFCSRTCRIDSLKKNGVEWLKDLGRKNVEDLLKVIQWNEDNNIRFFRLSSEMFPFASHATYGYSLDYCAILLAKAGALANKYGHRLTTHPGQYTQLGSPKLAVVDGAVRELVYHCEMLDLMGIGPDGVMIVHGGGMYDDKIATLGRIKASVQALPKNVRNRLVFENDELCYNAEDLLPLCEELDVPFVFDYHHDMLFPSSVPPSVIIERAGAIWRRRGIRPKQHLSEQRPGAVSLMERRAHADRCENLPRDLPDDMDLMIEAKDKEQAVLYLHRMYNLQPVTYSSLRPANANPSKMTNGRKSNKRARTRSAKEKGPHQDLDELDPDEDEAEICVPISVEGTSSTQGEPTMPHPM